MKNIIITGGNGAIGSLIQHIYCNDSNINIVVIDKNISKDKKNTPNISYIEFDLLDFHKYKELEKQISKSVNGTWDCLINNVSIINRKSFLTTDVDDLDKVFDLNLKSVILISQIFAKNNIKNKTAGNIINISSVASIEYSNSEKQFSYSLSKSLLNNLTKFLGASLGKYHICVNCLVLGNLSFGMTKKDRSDSEFNTLISNTKLNTPTNSIVSKSSIIESFSFLLHCNFDFTGNIIFLDGGYSL